MRTKHWKMAFYILVERGVLARALEYAIARWNFGPCGREIWIYMGFWHMSMD
jgi:hypothetical protein